MFMHVFICGFFFFSSKCARYIYRINNNVAFVEVVSGKLFGCIRMFIVLFCLHNSHKKWLICNIRISCEVILCPFLFRFDIIIMCHAYFCIYIVSIATNFYTLQKLFFLYLFFIILPKLASYIILAS
jgi:hypothetical protein